MKVRFRDVEAYQHADDEYFYRPLVAGEHLFTYIAHVPSGGVMPPDAEEAEMFELSLFMVTGSLLATVGGRSWTIDAGEALHIPRGTPFGVENHSGSTATFLLSFAPPPRGIDLATMKEKALGRGRVVIEPADVEERVGVIGFPTG